MTLEVAFSSMCGLLLPLDIPLGWSFAEAFSPLALSEDAHTLPESLPGFFFSPPPGVQRCDLRAKQPVGGLADSQVADRATVQDMLYCQAEQR